MSYDISSPDLSEVRGYVSPIGVYDRIADQMKLDIENYVASAVVQLGIEVDKEEPIKALQYDRAQYEYGYRAGSIKALHRITTLREKLDKAVTQLRKYTDCNCCVHSKKPLPNEACSLCSPEQEMWEWDEGADNG